MTEKNKIKKALKDIILHDKTVGPLGRVFSAPFFRSEDDRLHDLASSIIKHKKNGIEDYLQEIAGNSLELGKQVYEDVFVEGYAGALLEAYRPALKVAEANDTYDKAASLVELALDATIIGIPVSTIHRIVSTIGPAVALATLGVYTYKNTKKDPDSKTKNDSRTQFWIWAASLAAIEGLEFVPGVSEVANIAADPIDFYVIAANQTIAKGTSRKQFEEYFRNNHPGLYATAGASGAIIDAKFKDDGPDVVLPPLPLED